jgi:hypothetical protein
MIDGFRLKITSAELRNHCTERSSYHRCRAADIQKELPKFRESLDALKAQGTAVNISHMNKGGLYETDPVDEMEIKVREHSNKALVFTFFADHLFQEDYNLKEEDLVRLEVLKR